MCCPCEGYRKLSLVATDADLTFFTWAALSVKVWAFTRDQVQQCNTQSQSKEVNRVYSLVTLATGADDLRLLSIVTSLVSGFKQSPSNE